MIDMIKDLTHDSLIKILDVGTGSGAIAVTLAHELPSAFISACDVSESALKVAVYNNKDDYNQVTFFQSDLLSNAPDIYDIIAANLPYVDKSWERSPETNYEPPLALFAADGGLALIRKCIEQSPDKLTEKGYLVLEADPVQHPSIIAHAKKSSLKHIDTRDYIVVLQKI